MKILQANINHCARAQDLLFQSTAEWSIGVVVVAEPYYVPSGAGWVGDRDGVVAIGTQLAAGSPVFGAVTKGRGYVSALVGDVTLVGVYFSPNRSLADFEQFLVEVGALVAGSGHGRVLVVGDLNAKSTAWGSPATDARGELLEDWVVTTGMVVLNRGSADRCVRQQGGSIVDVTFADAILARRIRGWHVMEGVETLSDHRYVRFDVSALTVMPSGLARPSREEGPR